MATNIAIYRRRRDLAVAALREIGLDVEPPRVSLIVTTLIVPGAMILILLSVYFASRHSGLA